MANYTATLQWCYGAEKWSPEKGSRAVNDWSPEILAIPVCPGQEAFDVAIETMRSKINTADLPGRPVTNTISLSLVSLIDSSGNSVRFDRTKSFLERPVFREVSLMPD